MYKQFQYIIPFNGRTCDDDVILCMVLRSLSSLHIYYTTLLFTPFIKLPQLKPSFVQHHQFSWVENEKQPCVLTFDVIFFLSISNITRKEHLNVSCSFLLYSTQPLNEVSLRRRTPQSFPQVTKQPHQILIKWNVSKLIESCCWSWGEGRNRKGNNNTERQRPFVVRRNQEPLKPKEFSRSLLLFHRDWDFQIWLPKGENWDRYPSPLRILGSKDIIYCCAAVDCLLILRYLRHRRK